MVCLLRLAAACQAEARLLSHFGLLWVAREAASTEKQRAAEAAAARKRRPSSSSIGAAQRKLVPWL